LRATLRREEGDAGAFSATAVIGGSVLGTAGLVAVATDDADLRALLAFPAATTLLATSAGILRPAPFSVLRLRGLAAAALQLAAPVSLDEVALAAFAAWAALAGFAMLRQRDG
jgi:hypothetical protein